MRDMIGVGIAASVGAQARGWCRHFLDPFEERGGIADARHQRHSHAHHRLIGVWLLMGITYRLLESEDGGG